MIFKDWNFEYVKNLKKWEYYYNSGGGEKYYYAWRCGCLKQKCGIDLNPNVAGPGLHIVHGKVVVNTFSKIGNNVYIGTSARILGNITIADNVVIGANAVVTKSIAEPGITVAGIPAKKSVM